jgi:hypothetical protein
MTQPRGKRAKERNVIPPLPVTAGWCALGIWLGRKRRALANAQAKRDRSSPLTDVVAPEPA